MNPRHTRQLALALHRIRQHHIAGRLTRNRYWRLMAYVLSEHKGA